MEGADNITETEEERKTRLLAEAKALKAPHDPSWSADKLEEAVAKKRPKVATTTGQTSVTDPNPALVAELADVKAKLAAADQALLEKQQTVSSAEAMIATLMNDAQAMTARYNELSAKELEQFNELSDVKVELFELKQKLENNPDVPVTSDEFLPKDQRPKLEPEAPAPRAAKAVASSSAGTVRCVVTKHGHNQLFTGKEDGSRYPAKAELYLPAAVAQLQEEKGFVEIL